MNQLSHTLTSLEVGEMVGREHTHVMRDIRTIISHLGDESKNGLVEYFIESTYLGGNGQQRPSYLLTKKGCELYGTRMSGEKGTKFAVEFIERFNTMEEQAKNQLSQDPIELALQTSLNNYKEIKGIKEDLVFLKDSMRIDGRQEFALKSQGKAKVIDVLGGYKSPAYKALSSRVFAKMWGDFKRHFILPRSMELPKSCFDEAVKFIGMWRPDTSMALEIESHNRQTCLKLAE